MNALRTGGRGRACATCAAQCRGSADELARTAWKVFPEFSRPKLKTHAKARVADRGKWLQYGSLIAPSHSRLVLRTVRYTAPYEFSGFSENLRVFFSFVYCQARLEIEKMGFRGKLQAFVCGKPIN